MLARFRTRLSTAHALHLRRLANVLDALAKFAEEWREGQVAPSAAKGQGQGQGQGKGVEVLTSGELMARLGRKAEGVNLLEIEKYLRESKVRACSLYLCYDDCGGG